MKKASAKACFRFAEITSLVLTGFLLSSCSDKSAPVTGVSGKVIIKGSNTIGEELAPRLIAEYKKDHPAASFELETKGTGYGLAALRVGQCDLAGASRTPIKEEVELTQASGIELNDHVIGYYSVAVIVQAGNPVTNLTREQVRDIFTGVVKNWKEVGGSDAPIHLLVRDPISGTHLGFQELAMENKPYGSGLTTFTNYAGIAHAVAQDPNGIGYCSIDLVDKAGAKAVSIQSIAASKASINEGSYPYARILHFYSNKASESPATQDFLQFVQSPKGKEVLNQMGFVPRL